MDRLKARYKEDPYFALAVIVTGVIVLSKLMTASANLITSTAYAYRSTKI